MFFQANVVTGRQNCIDVLAAGGKATKLQHFEVSSRLYLPFA
jgi:hypothetical protein